MVSGWVGGWVGVDKIQKRSAQNHMKTEICKQKLYRNLWIEFLSLKFPEFPEARRRRRRRRSKPSP